MKITKVQDLTNRPVSTIELLMKYIFGTDKIPQKFIPGNTYVTGDIVYTIVDGEVRVFTCKESGEYDSVDTGFKTTDINSDIANSLNEFISAGNNTGSSGTNNNKDPMESAFEYHSYDESSIDVINSEIINLKEDYKDYDTFVELFINGHRLSTALGDYEIDEKKNRIRLIKYVIEPDDRFALYVAKGKNHNSRLVIKRDFPVKSIADSSKLIFNVDLFLTGTYNLFYKGKFIPDSEYTFELFPEFNMIHVNINNPSNYEMLVSNFVLASNESRSHHISAKENYYRISDTAMTSSHEFRLDLRHEDYNISDINDVRIFADGLNIDGCHISIKREILSITDVNDYIKNARDVYIRVTEYAIIDDSVDDLGNFRYNEESLSIINIDELRRFPIPFINYTEDLDYMIFKEDGTKVSARKFYEDDGMINYYSHEEGLVLHDKMNFHKIDTGASVSIYSKFVTVNTSDRFVIDIVGDLPKLFKLLIFTPMGTYISSNKYTINKGKIIFNNAVKFEVGDELEIVLVEYNNIITDTLVEVRSTTIDGTGRLRLPYFNIDTKKDNIIIFRSNGLYVGSSRYIINPDSYVVTFNSGTEIKPGDTFDIMVVQSLPDFISITEAEDRITKL